MTSDNSYTFVLVPGAWMGGWVWEEVAVQLRDRGHTAYTPTLAGLEGGTREGNVRLATHVEQVVALLDENDLTGVVLVGHSYSGLVVGQVADRRRERVTHTAFVQAFLPRDGRSLIDDWSDDPAARAQEIAAIAGHDGTWEAPIAGLAAEPDLSPAQRGWLAARFVDHPGRTVTDPARMARPVEALPATYIASLPDETDPLGVQVAALQSEPTWTVERVRAGHWPMVSAPTRLAGMLETAAARSLR